VKAARASGPDAPPHSRSLATEQEESMVSRPRGPSRRNPSPPDREGREGRGGRSGRGPARKAAGTVDALVERTVELGGDVRELGAVLREALEDKLEDLIDAAAEAGARGRDQLAEGREDVESYVVRHPVRTMLFAAGAGIAIGLLLRRS